MLKRDFIMVQIEELGKIIQIIINHRANNNAARVPDLIETVYTSLRINRDELLKTDPDMLIDRLDYGDGGGILRLETAIKVLIEESYLYPDQKKEFLLKAKNLLEYLQIHDNTFSLERVSQLNDIDVRLNY